MAKTIYTAEAHVTGGREHGHGATSDGRLDVQLRPPTDDADTGTNPEQLFAIGYAACFHSALRLVGRIGILPRPIPLLVLPGPVALLVG